MTGNIYHVDADLKQGRVDGDGGRSDPDVPSSERSQHAFLFIGQVLTDVLKSMLS